MFGLFKRQHGVSAGAPSLPAQHGGKVRAFISYSRADARFAQNTLEALSARDIEGFLDKRDIAPAEDWRQRLAGLIAASDAVVFILTPNSAGSDVCAWEVAEAERLGKRIVPLLHKEPGKVRPPEGLARLNYVFAREKDALPAAMDRLAEAVLTDIAWIREHTRLGLAAEHWRKAGETAATIIRGDELSRAEAWLQMTPPTSAAHTALHSAYIGASRTLYDAEEREKQDTLRKFLDNQSRFLADKARARLRAGDPIEALLIALEGLPDETAATALNRERPANPEAFAVLCEAVDAALALSFLGERPEAAAQWGAFARGGGYFAGATGAGVTLWRMSPTVSEVARLTGADAQSIAFSAGASKLCIVWRNGDIGVYARDTGALLHTIHAPGSAKAALDWSGGWLAATSSNGAQLWRLGSEASEHVAAPEIAHLAALWARPEVRALPFRAESEAPIAPAPAKAAGAAHTFSIARCALPLKYLSSEAYSRCGRFAARAYENHNGALVFERSESGEFTDIAWLAHDKESWREVGVSSLMFNADSTCLLTGSYDKSARIWHIATGSEMRRFVQPQAVVSAVYAPNEQFVVTYGAGHNEDWTTRLFAVGSGTQIGLRCAGLDRNHTPSFNEAGDLVFSAANGERTALPGALNVATWVNAARDLCHSSLTPEQRRELFVEDRPAHWHAGRAAAPHLPGARVAPEGSRGEQTRYAREVIVEAGAQTIANVLERASLSAGATHLVARAIEDHFGAMITPLVERMAWMQVYNQDHELAASLFEELVRTAQRAGQAEAARLMLRDYRGPSTAAIRTLREAARV